jgi:hypothetical protein
MKVREIKGVLARISFASKPGHRWKRSKPGSRRFYAPQHDLEALDLVAKSLYVTSTFMRLSPGGRMPFALRNFPDSPGFSGKISTY